MRSSKTPEVPVFFFFFFLRIDSREVKGQLGTLWTRYEEAVRTVRCINAGLRHSGKCGNGEK